MKFTIVFVAILSSMVLLAQARFVRVGIDEDALEKKLMEQVKDLIDRGEDVQKQLPDSHLRQRIIHYVNELQSLKRAIDHLNHKDKHNREKLEFKMEIIIIEFIPWLKEAEELVKKNETSTTTTEKPTTTQAPTTKESSTTTRAPSTTTQAPTTRTQAPTTTRAPSTTTRTPTTTEKPSTTTRAPSTTTQAPTTRTQAPTTTRATTATQITTAKNPTLETQQSTTGTPTTHGPTTPRITG